MRRYRTSFDRNILIIKGSILLYNIGKISINALLIDTGIHLHIADYIPQFVWNVITHLLPSGGLAKTVVDLRVK